MLGACILFLVGAALGSSAFVAARRARSQLHWPTAQGTVVLSVLGLGGGFYPDVQYTFMHDGRRYRGLKVRTNELSLPTSAWARRIVQRYPAGSSVKVYVDVRNPEESVLEPGRGAYPWLMGLLGLAFMTASVLTLLR